MENIKELVSEMSYNNLVKYIEELHKSKDDAYHERNRLVAFISKLFPSYLTKHVPVDDPTWDKEWTWVVIINAPCGQLSWHIHDNELPLFNHLDKDVNEWDEHTTEEKYKRMNDYKPAVEQKCLVNYNIKENDAAFKMLSTDNKQIFKAIEDNISYSREMDKLKQENKILLAILTKVFPSWLDTHSNTKIYMKLPCGLFSWDVPNNFPSLFLSLSRKDISESKLVVTDRKYPVLIDWVMHYSKRSDRNSYKDTHFHKEKPFIVTTNTIENTDSFNNDKKTLVLETIKNTIRHLCEYKDKINMVSLIYDCEDYDNGQPLPIHSNKNANFYSSGCILFGKTNSIINKCKSHIVKIWNRNIDKKLKVKENNDAGGDVYQLLIDPKLILNSPDLNAFRSVLPSAVKIALQSFIDSKINKNATFVPMNCEWFRVNQNLETMKDDMDNVVKLLLKLKFIKTINS